VLDSHPLLTAFQVVLFEHIIMCRLITGNKTAAIQEVRSSHSPSLSVSTYSNGSVIVVVVMMTVLAVLQSCEKTEAINAIIQVNRH